MFSLHFALCSVSTVRCRLTGGGWPARISPSHVGAHWGAPSGGRDEAVAPECAPTASVASGGYRLAVGARCTGLFGAADFLPRRAPGQQRRPDQESGGARNRWASRGDIGG